MANFGDPFWSDFFDMEQQQATNWAWELSDNLQLSSLPHDSDNGGTRTDSTSKLISGKPGSDGTAISQLHSSSSRLGSGGTATGDLHNHSRPAFSQSPGSDLTAVSGLRTSSRSVSDGSPGSDRTAARGLYGSSSSSSSPVSNGAWSLPEPAPELETQSALLYQPSTVNPVDLVATGSSYEAPWRLAVSQQQQQGAGLETLTWTAPAVPGLLTMPWTDETATHNLVSGPLFNPPPLEGILSTLAVPGPGSMMMMAFQPWQATVAPITQPHSGQPQMPPPQTELPASHPTKIPLGDTTAPKMPESRQEASASSTMVGDEALGRSKPLPKNRHQCPRPSCRYSTDKATRLDQHLARMHGDGKVSLFPCTYVNDVGQGCSREFIRFDNLRRHMRNDHRRDLPARHRGPPKGFKKKLRAEAVEVGAEPTADEKGSSGERRILI